MNVTFDGPVNGPLSELPKSELFYQDDLAGAEYVASVDGIDIYRSAVDGSYFITPNPADPKEEHWSYVTPSAIRAAAIEGELFGNYPLEPLRFLAALQKITL